MRRAMAVGVAVAAVVVWSAASFAELCPKCRGLMYTMDVGRCVECGGATGSGAFKLCGKCSAKLRQCEHCRAALGAAEKPNPEAAAKVATFKTLGDAVEFIAGCLDKDDAKALASACQGKDGKAATFTEKSRLFGDLKKYHAVEAFAKRYKDRAFPEDKTQMTLGGHASELGHIHIDFVKTEAGWALADIWMCR